MRILLLNWSEGENDPFSYFNAQLQHRLGSLGHEVHILPFNERLAITLYEITQVAPIDLVVTWQGIGSDMGDPATGRTLWELLDLPLVCLHGDHPCYQPANHRQSSRHVLHVYLCPSFQRDANRLIPREYPALCEALPNLFPAPETVPDFAGDHFVLPKNLTDPEETKQSWRQRCDAATYRLLSAGAEAIEQAFRDGAPRDHHEVLLDLLPAPIPELVRSGQATPPMAALVFQLGRELDNLYRNIASVFVLEALPEVPIRVNGRGWDRFAARGNPRHQFHPFDRAANGDTQFHSRFGIIDIAPTSDALHDRTLRAMRMGGGFLISSAWQSGESMHQDFADLFFGGSPGELMSRVEQVRADPAAHRARVCAFSEAFDRAFPMDDFVARIRTHVEDRGFALSD